ATDRLFLSAAGAASRFHTGNHLLQGAIAGSLFSPALGPLRAELAASMQGTDYVESNDAASVAAEGRLHLAGARMGAWAGGGGGRVWIPDGVRRTSRLAAGAWWSGAPGGAADGLVLRGGVQRLSWGAPRTAASSGFVPTSVSAPLVLIARGSFVLAEAAASWRGRRADLDLSAGRRFGDATGSAWEASGAFWLTDRFALAGGIGRFLGDPVQQLEGGHFATVGVRLRLTGPARARDAPAQPRLELRDGDDASGARTIVVHARGARRVEVMADFTDWQPVALARAGDDEWRASLPVAAGTHRVNVRVNGGAWMVPAGLTAVADDFAGTAGLLIVP
ncbi:MAG TPA: glycogen-binding domain-containing protein, partial [Gemmatimonadaceae bacterium]|nr:glycogen-binding domain-containing protein [Gemmatimonadaceae bacterium]